MTLVATILREQKLYLLGNKNNYKQKATRMGWPLFIHNHFTSSGPLYPLLIFSSSNVW